MAASATTTNPRGLGYQTPVFTLPTGTNVASAFQGRLLSDDYYRKIYYEQVVREPTMSAWMEQFGGVEYSSIPLYNVLQYTDERHQVKVSGTPTITAKSGSDGTGTITLSAKDHSVSGTYVEPIVGMSLLIPGINVLLPITDVTHSSANNTTVTVSNPTTTAVTLANGDEAIVVPGVAVTDCEAAKGQFSIPDLPFDFEYNMVEFSEKGTLCGDDLTRQWRFNIPFLDENGKEIPEKGLWFAQAQRDMYHKIESRKYYERLFNANFGLIPKIKLLGINFAQADDSQVSIDDIRDWKTALRAAGVKTKEYAVWAGTARYSQWMKMLINLGASVLYIQNRPMADCGWLDMNYCGFSIEGMTFHLYEEESFGNGHGLGAQGMVFPNSAIFIPMDDAENVQLGTGASVNRFGMNRNKKFTTVYYRSVDGRLTYDHLTDSNGIFGPRNSFGTGEIKHEWSDRVRFSFEVSNPESFGFTGL